MPRVIKILSLLKFLSPASLLKLDSTLSEPLKERQVVSEMSLGFKVRLSACVLSCFSRVCHFVTCGRQPASLQCPWDSQGTNTGVGCHTLLQGIFLILGSNLRLLCVLHHRQILYHWASEDAQSKTDQGTNLSSNSRYYCEQVSAIQILHL